MDKKFLSLGILFLLGSAYCLFSLITKSFQSYIITGLVLFLFLGLAFLKKAKGR